MAPPAWAFQVDIFDPPPDEELVCSICRGIFCDPVRSPCNHVYCRSCIYKWLENNRNCPICRKRTCRYDIQEVVPLIKNMIMKLTLKCHNLERGCEEKFTLEGCEAHLKECIYEVIRCTNRPCKEMILRRDIKNHELRSCLHRCIPCKKCGLKVSSAIPRKHNCIKALQKRLKYTMKVIKIKKQKIIDLKMEVQTLKDNSAASSANSIGEEHIMIDFGHSFTASDIDVSLSSTNSSSVVSDSEAGDETQWVPSSGDILLGLEQRLTERNSLSPEESSDPDDSIEVFRASTPQYLDHFTMDDLTVPLRRPPKRRLPVQMADSSSDEVLSEIPDAFPSPKRAWSRLNARSQLDNVASIPETGAGPSSVATTSAATNGSYFSMLPKLLKSPDENETSATAGDTPVTRSKTFERTIALLSRYNLESDPEWLPPEAENESDSSVENPLPSRDGYITSSDESSLIESDSDGSPLPPPRTLSLFNDVTLSSDDDPDDDNWMNY